MIPQIRGLQSHVLNTEATLRYFVKGIAVYLIFIDSAFRSTCRFFDVDRNFAHDHIYNDNGMHFLYKTLKVFYLQW